MSSNIRCVTDYFRWSEALYEVPEFLDRFERFAPFLMMVNDGYTGRDDSTHMIANDDVFWFHGVARQPRIVVEDEWKRTFSIPETHKDKIRPRTHSGQDGPVMTIADMVQSTSYKSFEFVENKSHTVYAGPDSGTTYHMTRLTYADRYDAKCLILHTVLGGNARGQEITRMSEFSRFGKDTVTVFREYTFIPAYIPILIAVAVGVDDDKDPERPFQRGSLDIKMKIDKQDHSDYRKVFERISDMLVFDRKLVNNEYDMIHRIYYDITLKAKQTQLAKERQHQQPQPDSRPPSLPPPHPLTKTVSKDSPKKKGSLTKMFGKKPPKVPKHKQTIASGSSIGKAKAPDPVVKDDNFDDDDEDSTSLDYEEIPEFTPEPMGIRSAPVAKGVDPEQVLSDLKRAIKLKLISPPSPPRDSRTAQSPDVPQGDGKSPPPVAGRQKPTNVLPVPARARSRGFALTPTKPKRQVSPPPTKPKRQVSPPRSTAVGPVSAVVTPKTEILSPRKPPEQTSRQEPLSHRSHIPQGASLQQNPLAALRRQPDNQTAIVRPMPKPTQNRISQIIDQFGKNPKLKAVAIDDKSLKKPQRFQMSMVKSIQDVPKDLTLLTVQDVSQCLEMLKLTDFVDSFVDCQVDGDLLSCLNEDVLKGDFGMGRFQAKKLDLFIKGWRVSDADKTTKQVERL